MAQHHFSQQRPPYNMGGRRPIMGFIASFWQQSNRSLIVAAILALALFAFEIFNFDTTKFALHDLLGDKNFFGITWAAILAFAFCAIDFAGLVRIFTPQSGRKEPKEVWYLMGAWLLGATMNAMMTWYAVSLLLLERPLGSEVLSREQLLTFVPIFVAVLVWLTRILFIGSLSAAGEHLVTGARAAYSQTGPSLNRPAAPAAPAQATPPSRPNSRVTRRPPGPAPAGRPTPAPMRARQR